MKKGLKMLVLGACIAFGVFGVFACGGGSKGGGNDCVYYLAGKSLGTAFPNVWYEKYTAISDIPDTIHFSAGATANTYTLTIDLYKSDQFCILTVGKGWTGQIGGDKVSPLSENMTDQLSSQDNGNGGRNFYCGVAGNYTITLDQSSETPVVTYVRNGDPIKAIHVDWNYYIKGEKVTAGTTRYTDYVKFKANTDKNEYTLEIGLQADDKITFPSIMVEDNDQKPEYTSADFTLSADSAAVIEAESATAEGATEPTPTGKYKIKGGVGTYKFTITEDENDARTLKVEKKAETVPEYDYYVVTAGDDPNQALNFTYIRMSSENGKFTADVDLEDEGFLEVAVIKKDQQANDKNKVFSITTAYADSTYISNQINMSSGSWIATAADTFTVTIDPVSLITKVQGENDAVVWSVSVWGIGGGWNSASETKDATVVSNQATVEFTLELTATDGFQFRVNRKGGNGNDTKYVDGRIVGDTEHPGTITKPDNTFTYNTTGGDTNLKCSVAGSYKFTLTLDADGYVTAIAIVAVTAAQ